MRRAPSTLVLCSSVLLGGLSARSASADVRLDVLFSVDGGSSWGSEVFAGPSANVRVGVFANHDAYDFAGATFRLTGSGLVADDQVSFASGTDQGAVAPFSPGAHGHAIYRSDGAFRIDAATDAADASSLDGVSVFLANPSQDGPVASRLLFAFDFSIGAGAAPRDVVLSLDQLARGICTVWTAVNATRTTSVVPTIDGGIIHVVPAPASLAMLAAAGFASPRRRRVAV